MACRYKYGHLSIWSKTQCLSSETVKVSLCYPETIESDGTQREIWSSTPFCRRLNFFRLTKLQSPFVIQRQSSLIACRDKYGHLPPLSKTQCVSTETIEVPLYHLETNLSDGMQRQIWSFAPLDKDSVSFDQDHCSIPLHPKTIKSDSTQRQIWSFVPFSRILNEFWPRLL